MVGVSSLRSASAVWLNTSKSAKYSRWVMGSYLWSWHCAQDAVKPIHTCMVVFTRSTTAATRCSSSSVPPSSLVMVLRWNAVANRVSALASGSKSPASMCSVKVAKAGSSSNVATNHSRHGQMVRARSAS